MICPSFNYASIDNRLATMLDSFRVEQLDDVPTCDKNFLDILGTHARDAICDVHVDDAGCISDHRFICVEIFFE